MKYVIIFLLLLVGCQKEIQWPEESSKKANACSFKIKDNGRYEMAGGELRGYFQLGGSDAGWYLYETTTYFVMVHDTIFNKYNVGDYLPITPNQ